jgi:hypothetical protein
MAQRDWRTGSCAYDVKTVLRCSIAKIYFIFVFSYINKKSLTKYSDSYYHRCFLKWNTVKMHNSELFGEGENSELRTEQCNTFLYRIRDSPWHTMEC